MASTSRALALAGRRGGAAKAEGDVVLDGEVREQRVVLEDDADAALLGGDHAACAAATIRPAMATAPRPAPRSPR